MGRERAPPHSDRLALSIGFHPPVSATPCGEETWLPLSCSPAIEWVLSKGFCPAELPSSQS